MAVRVWKKQFEQMKLEMCFKAVAQHSKESQNKPVLTQAPSPPHPPPHTILHMCVSTRNFQQNVFIAF